MVRDPLPIDPLLPAIAAQLRERGTAIVTAEPGAGKTSRVPGALLDAGLAGNGAIVLLEPRRLAARAAARRIASERGVRLGGEVGYHVRFDRCAGPATRLLVVTEGLLGRMLEDDPLLSGVGAVIFDEFHERSLDADLALALVAQIRREVRPDLRVVVMSATLDAAPIAAFLGDAPIVSSPGRLFPVDVEYRPFRREERLEEAISAAVAAELSAQPDGGDLLVFLPGVGEIRRSVEAAERRGVARLADLIELHGDLPPEQQDAALEPGARRRVIFSTNVAETSVTLPRVTCVIDSGLVRRLQSDPATGLDRLELGRISKASSEQRRGRAGRVAPGRCLRLWSALDQRGLEEAETPEIRRVDLAGLVLRLAAFGETDFARFPFFEPPDERALAAAIRQLEWLGALRAGRLTPIGRAMAPLPLQPRLARLLVAGRELGITRRAALAAALLSERDPFLASHSPSSSHSGGGPRRRVAEHESESDVVDRVAALEEFRAGSRGATGLGELHRGRADFLFRSADQFVRLLRTKDDGRDGGDAEGADEDDAALRRALLAAFPDRLARRREAGSPRAVLVGGRGVKLADESAVRRAELFLAIEVADGFRGNDEALVRKASAVERDWLDAALLTTEERVTFDRTRGAAVATRVTRVADLVLDERPISTAPAEAIERALAAAAAEEVGTALGLARDEIAAFLLRVKRLREWMPELALPEFDEAWFRMKLPDWCVGLRRFADLQQLPLIDFLRSELGPRLARTVDEQAPEKLAVPSGSAIRLDYPSAGAPILAVRMQELFGLAETPRIAAGRVAVVLHLLGPNHRPQQVTQDLASFWNTTYPKIRGELRARYPRHSWPDDPWNADPVRGPKKRRPQ